MRIGFLTEANSQIGFGHLYRSIAIAQALMLKNISIYFFLEDDKEKEIVKNVLPSVEINNRESIRNSDLFKENKISTLFVDVFHKNINNYTFLLCYNNLQKIIVIDDAFNAFADQFDTVFKIGYQNYKIGYEEKHLNNSKIQKLYSGSDFLIFRQEFKKAFNYVCQEKVNQILISMGGSDPCRLTELVLDALCLIESPLSLQIILGAGISEERLSILKKKLICTKHNASFQTNVTNISSIMNNCDMAIINGGNTRFELALIGVPFISIAMNEIQKRTSDIIANDGIGLSLDVYSKVSLEDIAHSVNFLINNFELRKQISFNMKSKINSDGARNVVETLYDEKTIFRLIEDNELDIAYNLHCELVNYMIKKGIRQWLNPIDKKKLEERQKKKENYGFFIDGQLQVFLSLTKRKDYFEWATVMGNQQTIWLNTVSVNIMNKNKGIGKIAILKALDYLKQNNVKELYLDCVINDGFLVNYYQSLGFQLLSQTTASYKSGIFNVALMKKKIN